MKVGDLVKDEFGNLGVVLEITSYSNGNAAHVQFDLGSGYVNNSGWILLGQLEVLSESR